MNTSKTYKNSYLAYSPFEYSGRGVVVSLYDTTNTDTNVCVKASITFTQSCGMWHFVKRAINKWLFNYIEMWQHVALSIKEVAYG